MTMSNTGGRRRAPTIHDVAREAGVSRGTVSRVLNGGHYVSPAAAEAVDAAIRKTGYVVNRHARSLITGRSDSIGFLLTEPQEKLFEDPNFNVLLRGCTQALAAHDIPLLLMVAGTADERRRITRYITAGHVDGVLLVSSHSGNPVAQELREAGIPLVQCGKPMAPGSKVSYVAADDRDGARDMVRHLLSLGRRRVGVVTGPLDTPGGVDRLAGYKEVLGEAGIGIDERLIVSGDYSRASGEAGTDRLLERAPDLDAVFVASDLMAQGALAALRRAGRRGP
ncbi:LacI family DNA-binding transcriptional regulator, partial [Streptomyces scabiei]|uniref:LacI family DNA-binding transcriptional regulator n=1 Tax=Streptomyces scabiei TaxID=1930 RepID=UPI000772E689